MPIDPVIIVWICICKIRGRLAVTTALVFFHRFYSRNSFKHHDRLVWVMGPTCPA
jgi:fatty-acid desaturase